jgi:hypothetical protein
LSTRKNSTRRRPRRPPWAQWESERLLDTRICDLGLRLEGTALDDRIQGLYGQLERRNIRFRPHFWLSDEWYSPSDIPGVAIPFYLAHPRLIRLERAQMLEAEGASKAWCMRILRHETGHAVEHAYRLRRRRQWQRLFGRSSEPYPVIYHPRPFSKRYVHHLDSWYAQSHPDEDFAETFAVWLTSRSAWRKSYKGWPALKKLEYVDGLMEEIADRKAQIRTRRQIDPVTRLRKTLRQHYHERKIRYGIGSPDPYDRDLRRLFSDDKRHARREAAAPFLRSIRSEALAVVPRWTSQSAYTVDQVLKEMISRCRTLRLRLQGSKKDARQEMLVLLAVHTVYELQRGRLRLAL